MQRKTKALVDSTDVQTEQRFCCSQEGIRKLSNATQIMVGANSGVDKLRTNLEL